MSKHERIAAIIVEPHKPAYVTEIENSLRGYYEIIDTDMVQVLYPFDDPVGIICDENGKLTGKELNRALYDRSGKMYDIISGTFIIVGLDEEDFCSLSYEDVDTYLDMYATPQMFVKIGNKILSAPEDV